LFFFHLDLMKQTQAIELHGQYHHFRVVKRPHASAVPMGEDAIKNEYGAGRGTNTTWPGSDGHPLSVA
jgi:hypothetical protein